MTDREPVVVPVALPEFSRTNPGAVGTRPISTLGDIPMQVSVVAGSTTMTLSQARALKPGDVIRLDRAPDATVDIYFNGSKAAVGDVIVMDDHLAARINEISERSRG